VPPDCGCRLQENPAISPLVVGPDQKNRFMHGMRFNMGLSGIFVTFWAHNLGKATKTAS
jgi:hypothetical protein